MTDNGPSHIKPRVFIGSSTPGLDVAYAIQRRLKDIAKVKVWKEEDWLGRSTLEHLIDILPSYDFAILVLRPDDVAEIKGETHSVARDNVLFELGLFMGKYGRERALIVFQKDEPARIPDDLLGINFAQYKTGSEADLKGAIDQIRKRIRKVWEKEQKKADVVADIERVSSEAGMLYRILNAASFPQYKGIGSDYFKPLQLVGDKSFADIEHVKAIAEELFSHYMFPHLKVKQSNLQRLRVYFAYYLGDGAILEPGLEARYCVGRDESGKAFNGTFVIGISNSSEKFPEQNWKSGLPLKGYSQGNKGQSLSNAAEAFRTADPKLIPNTDEQDPAWQYLNFGVANEKTVYSVPVLLSYKGWSVRESLAPIGILTISGSHPGMIDSTLRRRAEHLAILLGFIFYLHSKQNPDQPGVPIDIDKPPLPVGFKEGHTEEFREFLHRAVSLRREVAGHFEQSFINRGVHNWDGKELSTTLTP